MAPSMPVLLKVGFRKINYEEDHFSTNVTKMGTNMHDTNKIFHIKEFKSVIVAQCMSSHTSNQHYDIDFTLEPTTRKIIQAKCACKSGIEGKCKHALAAILKINTDQAVEYASTSKPCRWNQPKCRSQTNKREIVGFVAKSTISKKRQKLCAQLDETEAKMPFDFDANVMKYLGPNHNSMFMANYKLSRQKQ